MPQIPDINASFANRDNIGGVSIANPEVRDVRYGVKANRYEKISNILETEGAAYKQKWERKQAVQRQLTASQEQMNASILGDKLLQDARNLPDDEVLPFIQKGMEKFNAEAYKKYGGDQEMWGQVSLNVQRAALETQHNAFNFVQERAKDTALASFVEQEMYLKSKALNSKDPNIELAQLDASLDSLVRAGYMTKEQAAKSSVDARGDITVARISQMINNNNLSAAAQTLKANSAMLPLNAQIQLQNNIKSSAQALRNKAIAEQNKILTKQLKIQELQYTDPAQAVIEMGVDPQDTKSVFVKTGNRAVLADKEIKAYKARLDSAQTSTEFVNTYSEIYQEKVGKYDDADPFKALMQDKFNEQMRDSVSADAYTMIELSKNGATQQLQTLFESRKIKEEELNKIEKAADVIPAVQNNTSVYRNWLLANRTPDEVMAYDKTISRIARTKMYKDGISLDDAVAYATTGTADALNSIRIKNSEVPVPRDAPALHIQVGVEEYANKILGVNSANYKVVLDKNQKGYKIFNPVTGKRLVDTSTGVPLYVTVEEAALIGQQKILSTGDKPDPNRLPFPIIK